MIECEIFVSRILHNDELKNFISSYLKVSCNQVGILNSLDEYEDVIPVLVVLLHFAGDFPCRIELYYNNSDFNLTDKEFAKEVSCYFGIDSLATNLESTLFEYVKFDASGNHELVNIDENLFDDENKICLLNDKE